MTLMDSFKDPNLNSVVFLNSRYSSLANTWRLQYPQCNSSDGDLAPRFFPFSNSVDRL